MKNQKTILVAVFTMVFSLGVTKGEILFDNGGVNDIDWETSDYIIVRNDAFFDNPTTVNFVPGGRQRGPGSSSVYGSSIININGGSVDNARLNSYNSGQITISDGPVGWITSRDSSLVTVNGGAVQYELDCYGNVQVFISDGTIGPGGTLLDYGLILHDNAEAIISGGTVKNPVQAYNDSQANISGGTFEQAFYMGDSGGDTDTSIMEFVGTDFAINGTPVGYGEFTNGGTGEIHGTLTGTLANGDLIDNEYPFTDLRG